MTIKFQIRRVKRNKVRRQKPRKRQYHLTIKSPGKKKKKKQEQRK